MKQVLLLLFIAGIGISSLQAQDQHVNVDKKGIILKGYDPVAFFTESKAVKGLAEITSTYETAVYQFASEENKTLFEANPEKYKVQFGGWCAYAVSKGYTASIDIDTWDIINERLIFNYSPRVQKLWEKAPEENLKKADKNWPEVKAKNK